MTITTKPSKLLLVAARLLRQVLDLEDTIAAKDARIAELEAALTSFALAVEDEVVEASEDESYLYVRGIADFTKFEIIRAGKPQKMLPNLPIKLRVSHLRIAAKALKGKSE